MDREKVLQLIEDYTAPLINLTDEPGWDNSELDAMKAKLTDRLMALHNAQRRRFTQTKWSRWMDVPFEKTTPCGAPVNDDD